MDYLRHISFMACDAELLQARAVIFGAPFDGTTSFRPGTRFGPQAMRTDSYALESYSPYQDKDLEDIDVTDLGDLELPHGNPPRVIECVRNQTAAILSAGKIPVMLGGEHLLTLGSMQAVVMAHPGVHLVHFDAHTDLREHYLGEPLSHATVMRRIWEFLGDDRIHSFGIRSGEREEFAFARQHTDFHPFHLRDIREVSESLRGRPIYVSLDLDVLDPSIMPGTGTKEAGGVDFEELLGALLTLSNHQIVGFDVVELSPPDDPSGASTAVACKLLREMLLAYIS